MKITALLLIALEIKKAPGANLKNSTSTAYLMNSTFIKNNRRLAKFKSGYKAQADPKLQPSHQASRTSKGSQRLKPACPFEINTVDGASEIVETEARATVSPESSRQWWDCRASRVVENIPSVGGPALLILFAPKVFFFEKLTRILIKIYNSPSNSSKGGGANLQRILKNMTDSRRPLCAKWLSNYEKRRTVKFMSLS